MFCPKCGKDNKEGVRFCKYCGASLKTASQQPNNPNQPVAPVNTGMNEDKKKNYIIIGLVALIAIVILIAGLAAAGVFNSDGGSTNIPSSGSTSGSTTASGGSTTAQHGNNGVLEILGGSFTTGSAKKDKTYAHIYVGKQHAGETVQITAIWSRNGNNLNDGNILTRTVDSTGYVDFNSANGFSYFPDNAVIYLYYSDGTLADTLTVSLSPSAGTQTF